MADLRCVVGQREAEMCDWGGEFRHVKCVSTWLRDRADSFWRDAIVLKEQEDFPMAAAYESVAHELRACAAQIDGDVR
jgi:hypothetical protein